jgi:hypothetical protein
MARLYEAALNGRMEASTVSRLVYVLKEIRCSIEAHVMPGGLNALMAAVCAAIVFVGMTCPTLAQRILPPEQYDHPYTGEIFLTRKDSTDDVRRLCKLPTSMGAGLLVPLQQLVLDHHSLPMMLEAAGFTQEVVMRHETAHCNGWPKDHPGTRNWVREAKKASPAKADGAVRGINLFDATLQLP